MRDIDGIVKEVTEPIRTTLPPLGRQRVESAPTLGSHAIAVIAMRDLPESRYQPSSTTLKRLEASNDELSIHRSGCYARQACEASDKRATLSSGVVERSCFGLH
ncbi:hypothetical protein MANES_01G162001v8 [Manihot esculenta]|uniref:Uncharacterized protein n=1 Tax=Manihot esculenta TaxID=3983 RepID=A0ACB7IG31_MANES|nr:hypothetical protein MANES_01G162001v8 [Manihot esculenta]